MVEINNNYNKISINNNKPVNKTYYTTTPKKTEVDKLELSNKENNTQSKKNLKWIIGGIITAGIAIFAGIKTHKFIKNKKLQRLAEEEAERLKAEAKAKAEAEAKAKAEAEAKAKAEAEAKAKAEVEAKAKAEVEAKAKAKAEAEAKAKAEAEAKAKAEAEAKAKAEAEAKADSNITKQSKIQRPKNLPPTVIKGLDFGEDLAELIKNKNATPKSIQKLVNKHFKTDNIYVHSMSEYENFGPTGVNKAHKAATTRATFNDYCELEKLDIFLPEVDYNNPEAVLEYLDKTCHEFTHAAQMLGNKEKLEYFSPSIEGRLLNYIQKVITDKFTDKLVVDSATAFIKESKTPVKTISDYNKFMDSPAENITREKIGEILKLGKDDKTQKENINKIFDIVFDSLIQKMERDPNVFNAAQTYGGIEGLKNRIKFFCHNSFKNEEEAYKAGQIMRQEINGTSGKTTNNDMIHIIMGMCADALK